VLRGRGVEIKTPEQLAQMRHAGLVVAGTLELVADSVTDGITTADLDGLAEQHIRSCGAVPSFLGHQGFPASICVSVNQQVVHGIPGSLELRSGDLVSVDCGAIVDGWHGDAAVSVVVGGQPEPGVENLLGVTDAALWQGISAARAGGRVSDISAAVEEEVRSHDAGSLGHGLGPGLGIVEDYVGHGIGTAMHQPPNVPNTGKPGRGARLVPGIAIAIEPMVTLGDPETMMLDDDWTVVTVDGSWAAHFEHTVAVTETGVWVLTAPDGGRERLAALGVPYGGPA